MLVTIQNGTTRLMRLSCKPKLFVGGAVMDSRLTLTEDKAISSIDTMDLTTSKLSMISNGLVPVYETSTGEKVVYGSELHKALEVKSNYRDWVKNRFNDCDAVENEDYQSFAKILAKGGRPQKDHIIALDIAKEMAMLERNDKGKQVRRYFIEIEKRIKAEPKTTAEMLVIYANQLLENERRMNSIESKVNEINAKITTRNENYFTISGYASLRGLNVDASKANMLGRKAAKLSHEYGYDIDKVTDSRFGKVNSYHLDILKEVFEDIS